MNEATRIKQVLRHWHHDWHERNAIMCYEDLRAIGRKYMEALEMPHTQPEEAERLLVAYYKAEERYRSAMYDKKRAALKEMVA